MGLCKGHFACHWSVAREVCVRTLCFEYIIVVAVLCVVAADQHRHVCRLTLAVKRMQMCARLFDPALMQAHLDIHMQ